MFGIYDIYNKEFRGHRECIYNTPIADLTTDEDWLNEVWDCRVLFTFKTVKEAQEEIESWLIGTGLTKDPYLEVRKLPEDFVEYDLY